MNEKAINYTGTRRKAGFIAMRSALLDPWLRVRQPVIAPALLINRRKTYKVRAMDET